MTKRASVNDILIRIQAVASKKEVKLTYTNKMVYLKLIDFAEENSTMDFPVWIRCQIKTIELARYCSVSPRIITETLRRLHQCGIIKYTVKHPYPSVIQLYKTYYEKKDISDEKIQT